MIKILSKEPLTIPQIYEEIEEEFPDKWTLKQLKTAVQEMSMYLLLSKTGRGMTAIYSPSAFGREYGGLSDKKEE